MLPLKGLQSFAWHPFYIFSLTNIGTVIGETVVTPSSIVYLLSYGYTVRRYCREKELSVEEIKRLAQATA